MPKKRLTILEPIVVSKGGKNITDRVGKMSKKEAVAAGIDYVLHPWILSDEERINDLRRHTTVMTKLAQHILLGGELDEDKEDKSRNL